MRHLLETCLKAGTQHVNVIEKRFRRIEKALNTLPRTQFRCFDGPLDGTLFPGGLVARTWLGRLPVSENVIGLHRGTP
jgi:hypothetical protein